MSRAWLGWVGWLVVAAACGGRTDLGTRVETGTDGGSPDGERPDAPMPDAGRCDTVGQPCGPNMQCCPGLTCAGGRCFGVPPSCEPDGQKCSSRADCCSNSQCLQGTCCGDTLPCPACVPDNGVCSASSECCSDNCMFGSCCSPTGPCGGTCETDGSPCTSPAQCCSAICSGGVCGGISTCVPPTSGKCDTCVASSCCPQLSTCESDGTCSGALSCYTGCEGKGGTPTYCSSVCGIQKSPAGQALYSCAQSACASLCL